MWKKICITLLTCVSLGTTTVKADTSSYKIVTNNYDQTINDLGVRGIRITGALSTIGYIEAESNVDITILQELPGVQNVENVTKKEDDITARLSSDKYTFNKNSMPPLFSYQWAMQKITNNGMTYSMTKNNPKNVTVAVIDSGIDTDHEAFSGMIDTTHSENLVPAGGYDGSETSETGNRSNLEDVKGHGTAITGLIAAKGKIYGVSPGTNLQIYRVFGDSKSKEEWILKAIIDATNNGANIINLSLGQYIEVPENNIYKSAAALGYKLAVDYATSHNVAVVAAAGNDGLNNTTGELKNYYDKSHENRENSKNYTVLDYPSALPNTIAVGSSDNNNQKSTFSNYYDKNKANFILAPGGGTKLLNQYGQEAWMNQRLFMKEEVLSTSNDGNYNYFDGTSISTGEVSGELAEIINHFRLQRKVWSAKQLLMKNVNYTSEGYREINVYKAIGGH
ncbi:MAG: S8 family peptidase [Lactobacillaceae bacterium]